jgi:MFS family permease
MMNHYFNQTPGVRRVVSRLGILPWIICGLGALFYCYEYFLRISPSVMSVQLMRSYHVNATGFGNLTAFYYYAYTPMQLIVGVFMDRYGPRLLVTLACLACALGTYLFASSDILQLAELGRFLVGFGSAFAFVGALKLATIWLPPERFAMVSGMITALGMLGAMMGDVLLTHLVHLEGWRHTSMIAAAVGIVLALAIVLVVRDSCSKRIVSHTNLLHNFSHVFAGLLVALKTRQIWLNGLVGGLLFIPTTAFAELWGIPYLVQAQGFTQGQAATAVSMIFLGWVIGCPLVGFISDFTKRRLLPLLVGSVFSFIGICILLYVPHLSFMLTCVLFLIFGLFSCVQVLAFAIGRESSPKHIAGTAIALTNMFVMLSGVVFQPVIGYLLDLHWAGGMLDGARAYSVHNYQLALAVLPIGIAVAFITIFFMQETHCRLKEDGFRRR